MRTIINFTTHRGMRVENWQHCYDKLTANYNLLENWQH